MKHPEHSPGKAQPEDSLSTGMGAHRAQAKQRRKKTADQQRESKQTQIIAKPEAKLKARGSQAQPKTARTRTAQPKHCWQKARKTK